VSRTHEPWTDMELQELYEAVNDLDWFETVRPFLPNRSDAAIRRRMCQLREEAGIVPLKSGPRARSHRKTTEQKAQQGSDALRRRIMEMAA
jgi:hypothetical protein